MKNLELKKVNTRLDDIEHKVANCRKDKEHIADRRTKTKLSNISNCNSDSRKKVVNRKLMTLLIKILTYPSFQAFSRQVDRAVADLEKKR